MHDDFGVRVGRKPVASRFEVGAKFAVVVDLPVEGDPDGAILIGKRLPPAGEVNDGQPAVAENHSALVAVLWHRLRVSVRPGLAAGNELAIEQADVRVINPRVIRTSMSNHVDHVPR